MRPEASFQHAAHQPALDGCCEQPGHSARVGLRYRRHPTVAPRVPQRHLCKQGPNFNRGSEGLATKG
eukprot:5621848-Alexandrium_andersonii.AAC.1